MDIRNLTLRTTTLSPLINKGSELTYAELDANFVKLYKAFQAHMLSSYIDAYDNTATYDREVVNYVTYDSRTWKFINATPAAGVTPGTDPATWLEVYVAELGHRRNSDTILAEGTAQEVSAQEMRDAADVGWKSVLVSLDPAQILSLNSTPLELISAPGVGKAIMLGPCVATLVYDTAPYTAANSVELFIDTATYGYKTCRILDASTYSARSFSDTAPSSPTSTMLIENKGLKIRSVGADPVGGGSTYLILNITYRTIALR